LPKKQAGLFLHRVTVGRGLRLQTGVQIVLNVANDQGPPCAEPLKYRCKHASRVSTNHKVFGASPKGAGRP
jgi:hypothetical protein